MAEPDGPNLWALCDLETPWALRVAATLRIADHIAAGTSLVADLASATRTDAESLVRLLRHLVGAGVFVEPLPGRFALNAASDLLRDDHPSSIRLGLDLDGIGGRMAHAWCGLLGAVRSGRPAYAEVFGRPFWADLDAHPEIAASFDALMGRAGHGAPDPDVLRDGDWSAVATVVDVGGGTGGLLAEILRAHAHLRGILVDLPRTVARSSEVLRAAGVADRAAVSGQSFFDPLPYGADLYLLKNVLDDWPDADARPLLQRCAEAARPYGRVIVLGGVSPDDAGRGRVARAPDDGAGGWKVPQSGRLPRPRALGRARGHRRGPHRFGPLRRRVPPGEVTPIPTGHRANKPPREDRGTIMRVTGLFETHLTVIDLDRSVAFYRDLVGLELAHVEPERGAAFLWIGTPGQAMLGLWKSNPVLRMRLHLAFSVSLQDVLAAPAALRGSGVVPYGFVGEETDEPVVFAWMPAAVVFCTDPDGHSVEFLSMLPDPPRPELGVVAWSAWQDLTRA